MIIYDFLFYKGYQLAKRLNNWDDAPKLFAIMTVLICVVLNFASILFIIEGLSKNNFQFGELTSLSNEYRYVSGALVVLLIWWYYSYKDRGQKIVTKYQNIEKEKGESLHPVIVIIIAYVLSAVLINLAAMYRNGYGIFA